VEGPELRRPAGALRSIRGSRGDTMIARIDLHNHSCLSPCASLEMSPSALARRAGALGIDVLALTDHNSALNCPAFETACRREGILPLFGVEACSIEEVHLLCLFGTVKEALAFGELLSESLPDLRFDPARLGDQVVVDADDIVLGLPEHYLGSALLRGFDDLCRDAADAGALVIPAHVDRPLFSVASQLGFLPPGPYDAVEGMNPVGPELSGNLNVISGSDAHSLDAVGRRVSQADLPTEMVKGEGGAGIVAALRELLRMGTVRPWWMTAGGGV